MKRTTLILLLTLAGLLAGCTENQSLSRQLVVNEFKTTDVAPAPGLRSLFIVRGPDGSVWWVETDHPEGFSGNIIISKTQMFGEYIEPLPDQTKK